MNDHLCRYPGSVCICKEQGQRKQREKLYRHKWLGGQGKILWLRIEILFLFSSGVSLTARYLRIWMLRKHFLYFFLHMILAKRPKSNYYFSFMLCLLLFQICSYLQLCFSMVSLHKYICIYIHIYTFVYVYMCVYMYIYMYIHIHTQL